jgi:hypothetical protein
MVSSPWYTLRVLYFRYIWRKYEHSHKVLLAWLAARPGLYVSQCDYACTLVSEMIRVAERMLHLFPENERYCVECQELIDDLGKWLEESPPRFDPPTSKAPLGVLCFFLVLGYPSPNAHGGFFILKIIYANKRLPIGEDTQLRDYRAHRCG